VRIPEGGAAEAMMATKTSATMILICLLVFILFLTEPGAAA
jgi:hypothetical protein